MELLLKMDVFRVISVTNHYLARSAIYFPGMIKIFPQALPSCAYPVSQAQLKRRGMFF